MDGEIFKFDKSELDKILQSYSQQWSPSFNFSFHDVHSGKTLWFLNTTFDVPGVQDFYASFDSSHLFGNYPTNETYDFSNSVIWWPINEDPSGVDHFEIYAPCENCTTYSKMVSTTGFTESVAMQILSPVLNAIFRDTLLDTDNPALAWQALMTTVLRMAYYDWLPTFDSMTRLETRSKVPCQIPLFYRGFAIVMANLAVHLAIVTAAAVCFGRMTTTSLLNSSWQVVAQLKTKETERILDHATMAHDSEARRWIEQNDQPRRRFRITKNQSCGAMHLS
ncbi:hypothetical protein SLS56_008364 [Neofusicoccum ribis]|uniref:Uncharacterized protein n=1 Tax=Neofusicoccum ribis TaxID=45134 RepID=A0ABR3SKB7_9PEZI